MRNILRNILLVSLFMILISPVSYGTNRLAIGLGYVKTSSSNYASGFLYGVSITEGTGRVGFGVFARRFANTLSWETEIKEGGDTQVFRFEEIFSDFYLSGMATLNFRDSQNETYLLAGVGPEVHLLTATKHFMVEGVKITARDPRLGLGVILRYQRVIRMFGKTAFVLTGAYSWVESVAPILDEYMPPSESITLGAITAGLAFAF